MFHRLVLLISVALMVSSCASIKENRNYCIIAGSVAGAVVAGVAEDDSQSDAALGGAVIGGAVAWFFCQQDADRDGINDDIDRCPGSPKGSKVNASGCPIDGDDDGDGVANSMDRCPMTKSGVMVDSKGCDRDSDGDGVSDANDKCPNTPRGRQVNTTGCELDDDKDGVVNGLDQCPGTAAGKPVDHKGCNVIFTLSGVNFEYDSAELTNDAKSRLAKAIETLKKHQDFSFNVVGHTDSRGPERYNQRLSANRAEAVRAYLQAAGVNSGRMGAIGMGESTPIASNDTDEGRAMNRRVELVVTEN